MRPDRPAVDLITAPVSKEDAGPDLYLLLLLWRVHVYFASGGLPRMHKEIGFIEGQNVAIEYRCASVPRLLPAPGRFSMMKGWPRRSDSH
jgi:hypothetical protein